MASAYQNTDVAVPLDLSTPPFRCCTYEGHSVHGRLEKALRFGVRL